MTPSEHVHEVEERGQHRLLVHRHPEMHGTPDASHHHDGVLDHAERPVATLDAAYLAPPVVQVPAPAASQIAPIAPPPLAPVLRTPEYVELLIHGPPRAPAGLRAPPSVSRL
jgi:hypothetical protein